MYNKDVVSMKKMNIKKDDNILVSNHLVDFFNPKEVYVPLIFKASLNVKNKKVRKGDLLFFNDKQKIFSPISGELKNIEILGKQKYLVITNNFKEEQRKKINKKSSLKKEDILDLINKYYPTFNLVKNSNVLYFNALSDDIYNASNYFIFKEYQDELLEVLDFLREVFLYDEVKILLKENEPDSIKIFANILGRYPFISLELMPNFYPIANKVILERYFNSSLDMIDTYTLLNLVFAIIHREPLLDCYVTVSGIDVKPVVVKVKKGTRVIDVLQKLNIDKKEGRLNNVLNKLESLENLVVDENITSLLFFPLKPKSKACISCGKCLRVCPMGCEAILKKNMDKCISCGLCEYVCPSYLDLRR